MKKRIVFLSLFTMLFSCNDATEIVQDGELNDAALFKDVVNMQLFLNETYDRLAIENDLLVSSQLSDEVAIGGALTVNDTQRFFVVSTNGSADAIWATHYNLINYCNRVIRGATYFTPPAADVAQYNSILAQAKALRAFAHFELMVYFSEDLSNASGLGVMLLDKVPVTTDDIPRSTNGELFAFIENDLAFAQANLGTPLAGTTPVTAANSYKYINQNFINAFRARMYLYRKDYAQALTYADAVIGARPLATSTFTLPANYPATSAAIPPTGAGTGSTSINVSPTAAAGQAVQRALYTIDQWTSATAPTYRKMWVDADQGELLFAIDRPNNKTNFSSRYNTNGSYITGAVLFDMGRNLFNLYTQPFSVPTTLTGASSSGTTITVDSTIGLLINSSLTYSSGTAGVFAANTRVTSIINNTQFTVNQAPTTALLGATITANAISAQDFRRWTFVDRSSTISATPATATRIGEQIVIDKYPGKTGAHTANDVKVFRASEIYFIKAECLVRNGDLAGAADLIQQVRQARNYITGTTVPTPSYATATAAIADILLERRKELAFEGHRYIDLKRLGADAGVPGTDRDATDGANSNAISPLNILLGDYRFTLPIPQAEININPLTQNRGY